MNLQQSLEVATAGEEGEEEEATEKDPEVDPGEKRDYAKARKFARMLKQGQVPEEVVTLYNDSALQSKQPRLFKTELINRLFKKDSKGGFVLCHNDPEFVSWKKNMDKSFATQKSVGVPKSIMLWQVFQGNKNAMQDAEKEGDIYEVNGFWHHGKVTAGRTKSTTDTMQLKAGSVALDVDQFSGLSSFLGNRDWAKFGKECGEEALPASSSGRRLALQDGFPSPASSARLGSRLLVSQTW